MTNEQAFNYLADRMPSKRMWDVIDKTKRYFGVPNDKPKNLVIISQALRENGLDIMKLSLNGGYLAMWHLIGVRAV